MLQYLGSLPKRFDLKIAPPIAVANEVFKALHEEVEVFEDPQDAQIIDNRGKHQPFTSLSVFSLCELLTRDEVHE